MKTFQRWGIRLLALSSIAGGTLMLSEAAHAQQKYKYVFGASVPGKYVEQHVLEVGDLPGHQIRVAALTTKYAAEAPAYDGVKVVESFGWISSDYINGSGRFVQYTVLQMANGDKIYQNIEGQAQTSMGTDGGGKTSYSTVTYLKGGTGKFATLRGILRGSGVTDFKTGPTNNPVEGEYWFEK
jgi:hypothetical protein